MIAYFDSSSIVKWFFDEQNADISRILRSEAEISFTSIISYPEVMSAINRSEKEGRCTKSDMKLVKNEFLRIWPALRWIKIAEPLMQQSGEYIFKHNLRGFNAIHLASALILKEESVECDLFFSCFDRNLNRAAQKENLKIHKSLK